MPPKTSITLTPKRRFPESGEWESYTLGEIASFASGGTPMKNNPDYWNGDIPWISASSMHDVRVADSDKRVTAEAIGNGTRIAKKGTILVLVRGSMLFKSVPICIALEDVAFNQDVKAVRLKKGNDTLFILNQLIASESRLEINATGIGAGKIDMSQLKALELGIPSLPEQRKIADCLGSLDDLIAAAGRKLAALRNHKRGLMQQLFPKPGQSQPQQRFPEFRGGAGWKQEKLSQHITLVSGVHLSPTQYSEQGEIPYFTGPSDFTNTISKISKWTSATENKGVVGDILITVKGSGVGELWYLELDQVAMGRQLMAVRALNGVSRFFYQLLLSKRRLFEDLAMGNLIPGLSRGDILDMKTPVPTEAEQQKIAACLTTLDTQITAQAAQLDSLRQHKRGLMQQLFPSSEKQ